MATRLTSVGRLCREIPRNFSRLRKCLSDQGSQFSAEPTNVMPVQETPRIRTYNFRNWQQNSRWRHVGLTLPAALSLSLFGKKDDKPEDKQDEKSPKEEATSKPQSEMSDAELLEKLKNEDQVILSLKQARLAEHNQDRVSASKYYHRALNLLIQYEKHKTWTEEKILKARVHIYDCLANLYLAQGNLDQAERLFKEAMKGLLQQNVPKDHNALIEMSLKLAIIYAGQNRTEEAEIGYKYCFETQHSKVEKAGADIDDDSISLLGMCIDAYARFLLVGKRYKEATDNLYKALTIAKKVHGDSHPQVAVLLNDIATVASVQEDYITAMDYATQAVKVATKCQSSDLPMMYANLGTICIRQSKLKEGKSYCQKALQAAKKIKDKDAESQAQNCLDAIKEMQ